MYKDYELWGNTTCRKTEKYGENTKVYEDLKLRGNVKSVGENIECLRLKAMGKY